jgi:hypothetical protein
MASEEVAAVIAPFREQRLEETAGRKLKLQDLSSFSSGCFCWFLPFPDPAVRYPARIS